MKIIIFLLVLLYVICTALALTRRATDCRYRHAPGLICSRDCRKVETCIKTDDGWTQLELDTCFGNQACNLYEGGCSDKPGPCSSFGEMTCVNYGKFPDPFDCQRYYTCSGEGANSTLSECSDSKAYNVKSEKCDLEIRDAENCKKLPVDCKTLGQDGPWPWNANMYYVCKNRILSPENKVMYPALFKCGSGKTYKSGKGCV